MKQSDYSLIESYMLACMQDSAHDREHIYRVLNVALEIADGEKGVNTDVLIAACLLHDIGRKEQFENPALCHAEVGAKKAYDFLVLNGFSQDFSQHVSNCIRTHRFRGQNVPQTIEARILFDADKIDVTGTLGIARTLFYNGNLGEPLYTVDKNGNILDGTNDTEPSFFQEYKYKLEKVYDKMLTDTGKKIAESRRLSAVSFYENMLYEVRNSNTNGKRLLGQHIE